MFEIGKWYSLGTLLMKSAASCRPTYLSVKVRSSPRGSINKMNPEAPDRVYPAMLPRVLEKAELFVRQGSAIPVCMKKRKSDRSFEYVGRHTARALNRDQASLLSRFKDDQVEMA